MSFDKDQSTGFAVNHMARLFASALGERIQPLGLTTGQFPILLELWREDGLTQKDLVARLDLEQATVANTLTRMERDGLILRKPNPEDGRSQRIHLTRTARALEAPATKAAQIVNDIALKSLTSDKRAMFLDLIGQVIGALQADLRR
ncbi:MarR family winged helix-turn-helix transcriptional regulator [Microvirga terricola]|uniref:MarR family transcriptional regulator n=1 Tax=Microvirga terricola TaxID=2719797 RepID=A0ABX0V7G7_9HYPH|nr:MarR family transcriptional regulator [Microvirga terricola]NIX75790.1 MarR family transcriptional regulator [Microvirga terricola]